ncbi:MAG TPA: hypothetical protein VMV23_04715 [Candidatus Nanopelagicaceae bacterium]|nr:hypothetical protein [Candidatus Nanopelagicaceae bacterium]
MPGKSPSQGGTARRRWRPLALGLVLVLLGGVTLVAMQVTPIPNGIGVLPGQETILNQSGLTLQTPVGKPGTDTETAVRAATKAQPQSSVKEVVLATVVGGDGTAIGPPGRLCWIVFLNPSSDSVGDAPVPGQIDLDAVLVDAHSGAVIEGFISFRGTTPHSEVGAE